MKTAALLSVVLAAGLLARAAVSQSQLHYKSGRPGSFGFGATVAGLGDLNGDGSADFAVGAPGTSSLAGYVAAYSGNDGEPLYTWTAAVPGDGFGSEIAGLGDITGDGTPDLLISAPMDSTFTPSAGAVTVYSGASGAPVYTLFGRRDGGLFGYCAAALGDLDGDAITDLAIGEPYPIGLPGSVHVYSGRNGAELYCLNGATVSERFGFSVSGPGDIDQDGNGDLLVGSPFAAAGGLFRGQVHLFTGSNGTPLLCIDGTGDSQYLGFSLGGPVGDWNGDLVDDLLAGEMGNNTGGPVRGAMHVLSGASGLPIVTWLGNEPADAFGFAVVALGDVDGDGVLDVGGATPSGANGIGHVRVFSGADHSEIAYLGSTLVNATFGTALAAAGDLNGDGYADWLVGAPDIAAAAEAFAYTWRRPNLAGPNPGVAGVVNELLIAGAPPYARVYFLYGQTPGWTSFLECPGVGVAIEAANLAGTRTAGPSGSARFLGMVPPGVAGLTLRIQAYVPTTCSMTNMVTHSF